MSIINARAWITNTLLSKEYKHTHFEMLRPYMQEAVVMELVIAGNTYNTIIHRLKIQEQRFIQILNRMQTKEYRLLDITKPVSYEVKILVERLSVLIEQLQQEEGTKKKATDARLELTRLLLDMDLYKFGQGKAKTGLEELLEALKQPAQEPEKKEEVSVQ